MNTAEAPIAVTAEQVADRFAEVISSLGSTTHGELLNRCADLPLKGDLAFSNSNVNVAIFVGCSKLFCDAIRILLCESPPRAHVVPCHLIVLMMEGSPIPGEMKLAGARIPKGGYKTLRFAPVHFLPWQQAVRALPELARIRS